MSFGHAVLSGNGVQLGECTLCDLTTQPACGDRPTDGSDSSSAGSEPTNAPSVGRWVVVQDGFSGLAGTLSCGCDSHGAACAQIDSEDVILPLGSRAWVTRNALGCLEHIDVSIVAEMTVDNCAVVALWYTRWYTDGDDKMDDRTSSQSSMFLEACEV